MEIFEKIDWITATKKVRPSEIDGRIDKHALLKLINLEASRVGVDTSEFEIVRGDGFYAMHILYSADGVRASADFDTEGQGLKLVFSGKSLPTGDYARRVLSSLVDNDWKPTRVDHAVDVFNSGVTVKDVYLAYDKVHGENKQRSVEFKSRKTGDSLYIGARTSEKMLRVYDKAGEQSLDNDWVRYEMEYKGSAAVQVVPRLLASARNAVMAHVGFLSLPSFSMSKELEEFSQGTPFKFERKLPSKDGQEKWLYDVVGKKLAKMRAYDRESFDALLEWVVEMSQGYEMEQEIKP